MRHIAQVALFSVGVAIGSAGQIFESSKKVATVSHPHAFLDPEAKIFQFDTLREEGFSDMTHTQRMILGFISVIPEYTDRYKPHRM